MLHEEEIARLRKQADADPAVAVRLCDTLIAEGQPEEAATLCRQLLKHRPDDVELRLALGRALSRSGNLEEAQAALIDAVARKRRITQQNLPTGQPASPRPSSGDPVPQEIPPSSTARLGVPTPIAASGTARHAVSGNTSRHVMSGAPRPASPIPAPIPTAVPRVGTSRHELGAPRPLSGELPRPLSGELPVSPPLASRRPLAPLPSTGTQRMPFAPPPPPPAELPEPLPMPDIIPPELMGEDPPRPWAARPEARGEGRSPSHVSPLPARTAPVPPPLPPLPPPLPPLPPNPLPRELADSAPRLPDLSGKHPAVPSEPSLVDEVLAAAADVARGTSKLSRLSDEAAALVAPLRDSGAVPTAAAELPTVADVLTEHVAAGGAPVLPTPAPPPLPPPAPPASTPVAIFDSLHTAPEVAPVVPAAMDAAPLGELAREASGIIAAPIPIRREASGIVAAPVPIRREASGIVAAPVPIRREASGIVAAPVPVRREASGIAVGLRPAVGVPLDDGLHPPAVPFDLEGAARRLLGDPAREARVAAPTFTPSRSEQIFDQGRSRIFAALWVSLGLVCLGALIGWGTRTATTGSDLRQRFHQAATLMSSGVYEDALGAQRIYQQALRRAPRDARALALSAELEARLAADHGEDSEDRAFALLRRAQQVVGNRPAPDDGTRAAMRRAQMLLSLAAGEPCPPAPDGGATRLQDGDVAARCALQRGDLAGARQLLTYGVAGPVQKKLWRGALALSLGDLDEADHAFRSVLDESPQQPRALIGRALIQIERGVEPDPPNLPAGTRPGPLTEAFVALIQGYQALHRGDMAAAATALDRAEAGWRHDARLAVELARARLLQGRLADAEAGLRLAQRRFPGQLDVRLLDAEVALVKGHEAEIIRALTPLLAAGQPDSPRLLSVLGQAQFQAGDYAAAAATLDRVLSVRPGDVGALSYRALCRARLGAEREAFQELTTLAARPLPVTTPRWALAVLAYERKDLDRAAVEAGQAVARCPESAWARALLGRVLREQGKLAEAIPELQRVTREAPAVLSAHKVLGRAYLDLGRVRDARQELLRVVESGKQTVEDYLVLAEALLSLGQVTDVESVLGAARAAGATEGKLARAELILSSLRGTAQAQAAAQKLEDERRANGRDSALALTTAYAWLRAGDLQSALDDFEAVARKAPVSAALGIGRTQLRLHHLPEAEAAYRAALQQVERPLYGPEQRAEARAGLCWVLLQKGAADQALEAVQPSLAEDPSYAEAFACQGRALLEKRRVLEARTAAQRAVDLDPRSGEACVLLAEVELQLADSAVPERFRRCLELNLTPALLRRVREVVPAR